MCASGPAGKQGQPDADAWQLLIENFSIWVYTCFDF
jgi:hypothetical protein